jgi:hypothetical protein
MKEPTSESITAHFAVSNESNQSNRIIDTKIRAYLSKVDYSTQVSISANNLMQQLCSDESMKVRRGFQRPTTRTGTTTTVVEKHY